METLYLTNKQPWFEMLASGVKREEYRDCTAYWVRRLITSPLGVKYVSDNAEAIASSLRHCGLETTYLRFNIYFKSYDNAKFTNGYRKDSPTFTKSVRGVSFGIGRAEWGASEINQFIIKI